MMKLIQLGFFRGSAWRMAGPPLNVIYLPLNPSRQVERQRELG